MRISPLFEHPDCSLDDVYRCLTQVLTFAEALYLHRQLRRQGRGSADLVYYDVTNHYFETDRQEGVKRKGSPENTPQTGLCNLVYSWMPKACPWPMTCSLATPLTGRR